MALALWGVVGGPLLQLLGLLSAVCSHFEQNTSMPCCITCSGISALQLLCRHGVCAACCTYGATTGVTAGRSWRWDSGCRGGASVAAVGAELRNPEPVQAEYGGLQGQRKHRAARAVQGQHPDRAEPDERYAGTNTSPETSIVRHHQ